MHAVTRLGRVIQQLRSFGDLHANELEAMAVELDAAGAPEVAARLRIYRDMQRDESQIVVDELADIQNEAATQAPATPVPVEDSHDPAINSPKRARWLAEQAAEAERLRRASAAPASGCEQRVSLRQPFSRRDLFSGGVQTTND